MPASEALVVLSIPTLLLAGLAHRDFRSNGGSWRAWMRNLLLIAFTICQCVGWSLKIGGF